MNCVMVIIIDVSIMMKLVMHTIDVSYQWFPL